MSAAIFKFENFNNSAKGLVARPILPNKEIAIRDHIASVAYAVYNITDGGAPTTGDLDVATVMFNLLQSWQYDAIGYTFLWDMDGALTPAAPKVYRVVLTFTLLPAVLGGKSFRLAWESTTKDPAVP